MVCGNKRCLCPHSVPDIEKKEGSSGPRHVASRSHCAGGQYLTYYVSQ